MCFSPYEKQQYVLVSAISTALVSWLVQLGTNMSPNHYVSESLRTSPSGSLPPRVSPLNQSLKPSARNNLPLPACHTNNCHPFIIISHPLPPSPSNIPPPLKPTNKSRATNSPFRSAQQSIVQTFPIHDQHRDHRKALHHAKILPPNPNSCSKEATRAGPNLAAADCSLHIICLLEGVLRLAIVYCSYSYRPETIVCFPDDRETRGRGRIASLPVHAPLPCIHHRRV